MQYSIVNYSQISKSLFRLEAEFYNSNSLLDSYCFSGEDVIDFVQYGTSEELNEEKRGYPTLRLNEFSSFFIKHPQKYCDKIDDETYQSLALKKGDVLICRTNGNPRLVGKSAIVPENCNYAFASYLFRVRPKEEILLPTTLVTYLNSAVGRAEIEKHLMVSNQANFSPAKFREILIPQFGEKIQSRIDKCIWESYSKHSKSKQIYTQAETLFLSDLGLADWHPKHQLTFVKNYSANDMAERIDAEYFQPKYEEVDNTIKNYPGGWERLEELCELVGHPSNPPYSDAKSEDKTFIVVQKHLGDFTLTDAYWSGASSKYTTKEFVKKYSQYVLQKKDLVLYTVGGPPHIGKANIIFDDRIPATIGSFVTLVRANENKINPFLLLVLFNSPIGYLLTNRFQRGMVQQYIYPKDLVKTVIPIMPEAIQAQIEQKVVDAFNLQEQSKRLLEFAKRAVEISIEQDEQTAIDWLENATNRLHR